MICMHSTTGTIETFLIYLLFYIIDGLFLVLELCCYLFEYYLMTIDTIIMAMTITPNHTLL